MNLKVFVVQVLDDDADSYGTPADKGILDVMRDDFSARTGAKGDGYIDIGVENIELQVEETAIDNAPDNHDVDETKIPGGKSIAHHLLFNKAVFLSFDMKEKKCGIIQNSFNLSKF